MSMPKLLIGRPELRSAAATPGGIAGAADTPPAESSRTTAKAAAARVDRNVVMGGEPTGSVREPPSPVPMSYCDVCRSWRSCDAAAAAHRHRCDGKRGVASARLAERQVDALAAEQRIDAVLQREHAVVAHSRVAAPDDDVAVFERHAHCRITALRAAEQECRRQAERDRNDRLAEVALVGIAVQREPRARDIA